MESSTRNNKNNILFLLYCLTGIIIMLTISFIINKQYSFIGNAIVLYIIYIMIFYYEKKEIIKITNGVNFLIFLSIILHLVGGQYFNFYNTNSYFDKGLHLIGTFAISLFAYQLLISFIEYPVNFKLLTFILVSCMGISIGVWLEMLEFTLDSIFHSYNQKGLLDTDLDLLFNIIGANLAGLSVIINR